MYKKHILSIVLKRVILISDIKVCKECGFILGTRPNSKDVNGVCLACLNKERKGKINWNERQQWLTTYLEKHKNPDSQYDVVVGVSGGKDSHAIVKRLIEIHNVPNDRLLLVHVCDEFTPSKAGVHNLDNLVRKYNVDLINFRCAPQTFISETRKSFLMSYTP
ncbi:hypothetical protein [Schwartzia succinivorans]|uniref:hypothetical protein n=1 Tax=Schwartzia succinivorans TaxID=55507 RepID=UPI002353DB4A|nr:hypothetical protein [Schwartzia succinivorans]